MIYLIVVYPELQEVKFNKANLGHGILTRDGRVANVSKSVFCAAFRDHVVFASDHLLLFYNDLHLKERRN